MITQQKVKMQFKMTSDGAILEVRRLDTESLVLRTFFNASQLGYFLSNGYVHHDEQLIGEVTGQSGREVHVDLESSMGTGINKVQLTFSDYVSRLMVLRVDIDKVQFGLLILGKKLVGLNAVVNESDYFGCEPEFKKFKIKAPKPHMSANEHQDVVYEFIEKELSQDGWMYNSGLGSQDTVTYVDDEPYIQFKCRRYIR